MKRICTADGPCRSKQKIECCHDCDEYDEDVCLSYCDSDPGDCPYAREADNTDDKNNLFIKIVRGLAKNMGFEVIGRIHIRHIESGREYR